ncbi:LysR family transcriptional regulator [Paenibacillus sp. sptzw28]|uniref:LysR family transcriptional regulator n=1 Tax=Paenibacillus sp. sptzw28 TaxID=715179 RepID=UPI001C6DDD14|nr:LysR family transcriptional regulator [Paenibacillus sp. sptzw28]QYR20923.1 LysR family transcriptional regulator [Paenibacillus sp. sptzw28]
MDSRKLKYFMETALAGSFTRAAEQLMVAQPAISKSIQKLEEELQLTLFDRSERTVTLTPEGRVLLRHARFILGAIEEASKEMEELRGLERGEIRIGLPSMFGSFYFPQIIKEFKKMYPALHISVVEEGTLQVCKLIERKVVDLGIITADEAGPEIDFIPVLKEEMVACFPKEHPLADRTSVSLGEMLCEPLILFKEGYYQRKLILEASREANITPNITFSTNQLSLIRSLVAEGIGSTLFLRMVASSDPLIKPVSLDPPIFLHMGAGINRNTYLSKASQTFLQYLKHRMSRL